MYKHLTPLDRVRNAVLYELHTATAALSQAPTSQALVGMIEAYETTLDLIDKEAFI